MPKISQKCPKGAPKKSKELSRGCREGPKHPHRSPNGGSKNRKGATRGYEDDPAGSPKQARGSPKGGPSQKVNQKTANRTWGWDRPRAQTRKNQEKIPRPFLRQPSWSVNSYTLVVNQIVSAAAWRTWYRSLNAPPTRSAGSPFETRSMTSALKGRSGVRKVCERDHKKEVGKLKRV